MQTQAAGENASDNISLSPCIIQDKAIFTIMDKRKSIDERNAVFTTRRTKDLEQIK
jgi:hypothetical protein